MKTVHYEFRIKGLKTPDGTIPMSALKEVCDVLTDGAERALRLSIEGTSGKKGKIPAWLKKSADFVITGIGKGSTTLQIEAPTLKETAFKQIQQQDIMNHAPDTEDTALSLLTRSFSDATSEQRESERYDEGVLNSLLSFEGPLKYAMEFELTSKDKPRDHFKISREALARIGKMKAETPQPRAVVLSGFFNMIEHNEKRFHLTLEDGRKIPGVIDAVFIDTERMRNLWAKRATIKGTAYFKPSGKARFIEAQVIKPFEEGEEVFQKVMEYQPSFGFVERLKRKHAGRSPLMEVWGKWPGDESIDEILSVLKESSKEN